MKRSGVKAALSQSLPARGRTAFWELTARGEEKGGVVPPPPPSSPFFYPAMKMGGSPPERATVPAYHRGGRAIGRGAQPMRGGGASERQTGRPIPAGRGERRQPTAGEGGAPGAAGEWASRGRVSGVGAAQ